MRFEGGQELATALRGMPDRVSKRIMAEALRDGAEPIRQRMADLAPRGPEAPHFADQIVISAARATDDREGGIAVGPAKGSKPYYSGFIEFGTVHLRARPFARPAFDATVGAALAIINRALWVALAGRGIGRTSSSSGPISGGPGGSIL